jgi:protein Cut8
MGADAPPHAAAGQADTMSIRQQLLNGSYGVGSSASIGAW